MTRPKDTKSVFLSYRHGEEPYARAVVRELTRRGIDVGQDGPSPESGGASGDALLEELASAGVIVIFVAAETLRSPWANFEIGVAIGQNKPAVLVFLTEGARTTASHVRSSITGIDAHSLRPDEVAERIARVVEPEAA